MGEVTTVIKAAYTTGMAAIILAGLVLVRCVQQSVQQANSPVGDILTTVERSRQSDQKDVPDDLHRESPLVQQAQAFALYLNPAPASSSSPHRERVFQVADTPGGATPSAIGRQPLSPSPKFELHGISYYRADPNRSMALICEPGGNRRWVRQGDLLGHAVVERIDTGCLVCREGERMETVTLASKETIAQFAQEPDDGDLSPKLLVSASLNTPAPVPIRGIRQMPPSRVAAKLGQSFREVPVSGQNEAEME